MLARASTSWIALSTYLDNFRKSCQRIFNLQILDCPKCGFEESKRQTGSAPCHNQIVDVHLHCLHLARKKNVVDIFARFCGLEGWPGWKMLNRKYSRSSIFNAGGKTLVSLAQTVKFLGDQD